MYASAAVANPYHSADLKTAADTPATFAAALGTFYSHGSPIALTIFAVASLVWRLTLGPAGLWDLAIVLGMLALWPLQEWLIHVFILHFKPREWGGRRLDLRNAKKHRAHHRDPWRLDLVFIPWFTWAPAPLIQVGLWSLLTPTQALAFTGVTAYFILSLHYEWSHYLAHIRWRPPLRHYQRIVDAHRRHHFKSERHWYGVSMTRADDWLGTNPPPSEVPTSSTVRDLGIS